MRTVLAVLCLLLASTGTASAQRGPRGCGSYHFRDFVVIDPARLRANGPWISRTLAQSADLNHDGVTDLRDLAPFRDRYLFHRLAVESDLNLDGVTNLRDFALLRGECSRGSTRAGPQ